MSSVCIIPVVSFQNLLCGFECVLPFRICIFGAQHDKAFLSLAQWLPRFPSCLSLPVAVSLLGCVLAHTASQERPSDLQSNLQATRQGFKYSMLALSNPAISKHSSAILDFSPWSAGAVLLPLSLNFLGDLFLAHFLSKALSCSCLSPSHCEKALLGTLKLFIRSNFQIPFLKMVPD